MSERVELKYEVRARGKVGRPIPAAVAREVLNRWVSTGRVPTGFKLRVAFRNPKRKVPGPWKWSDDAGQSLGEIRRSLRLPQWRAFGGGEEEEE